MEWQAGRLNLNLDTMVPVEERFRDRYLVGLQMLIRHKELYVHTRDQGYAGFLKHYEMVQHATLLDLDRAYTLFQTVRATTHVDGCTAECGVYRGGASVMIAGNRPDKKHYALDTFEGFPDAMIDLDVSQTGTFSDVSLAQVQQLFSDRGNIILLKGPFSRSFEKLTHETFSFIHVDADLYDSTIECCEFFYPRLAKGGILLFDDYLVPQTPGVKKAVDEFFADRNEVPIVLPTCQAMAFRT